MPDEELTPDQQRVRDSIHKMFHFILWEKGVTRADCPRCQTFTERWKENEELYRTTRRKQQ